MKKSKTGFSLDRSRDIPALDLRVEEYTHATGAKHFHLANDHAEKVFMVAFRTLPEDSTGVAHVLEHTVLCGSEKFPVRDPFFLMLRRSLNTFMNAFTTSDYTAYPFASQNEKDYFNLMEVYLDAVFFARLDSLDFAQEGHRIEFEEPDNPDSPLLYKGVVYNEMKGDTSSPLSRLYQGVQETLYPTSAYHHNSGGDPAVIPELTCEQLRAFYRSHYHPSNAVFMTFGNLSAAVQQEKIASLALDRLAPSSAPMIAATPEKRYGRAVSREISYPADDKVLTGKTHIVVAWLLGKNTDPGMLIRCQLLSDVLLDTSASPLRQALEKTELATAASPLCGFEEDNLEMNFVCGVEGSDPEHADAVEKLVLDVLRKVETEGVEQDRLEAVMHQIELSRREIGGDGWPYGLQLIFSCMSAAVHRGDPIGLLDVDAALAEVREEIRDPAFMPRLIRELLLDNKHRVRLVMKPDRELGSRLVQEERKKLDAIQAALSDEDKKQVVTMAATLKTRQERQEDMTLLPGVTRSDIPVGRQFPSFRQNQLGEIPVTCAAAGTNGITWHQIVSPLPDISRDLLGLLPVYIRVVSEVGSAGRDYLETQHRQHSVTGGISALAALRPDIDNCETGRAFLTLSSRTLNKKAGDMARLLFETAFDPRFDELDRLRELVRQFSMRQLDAVAANGHQYAMSAAAAALRPVASVNEYLSGISGLVRLKQLASAIEDEEVLTRLGESLLELHTEIRATGPELLLIAESDFLADIRERVADIWSEVPCQPRSFMQMERMEPSADRAFVVTTQVNHCAAAWATVPENHEDSASLAVLAGILRNQFLHVEIREKGGAYGAGAGHDSANGVFRCFSYRDPRLIETFDAFTHAVEWAGSVDITDEMLEEAVLGIIRSVDAPASPAGEVRHAWHHQLHGRTAGHRETLRKRYLEVRKEDIRRVVDTWLTRPPVRALVTSENRLPEIDDAFVTVHV